MLPDAGFHLSSLFSPACVLVVKIRKAGISQKAVRWAWQCCPVQIACHLFHHLASQPLGLCDLTHTVSACRSAAGVCGTSWGKL